MVRRRRPRDSGGIEVGEAKKKRNLKDSGGGSLFGGHCFNHHHHAGSPLVLHSCISFDHCFFISSLLSKWKPNL